MNKEELDIEVVRQLLDRSSGQAGPLARARLTEARVHALARYDARSAAPALAWAGSAGHRHGPAFRHGPYFYWVAALLFAITLFGVAYWKQAAEHDVSDVDIAILTDDLPIEMYVE